MKNRNSYCTVDIIGQRFGRLVAISKIDGTRSKWLFQCDCGDQIILPYSRVLYGQLSCGCLRKEVSKSWANSHRTHGASKTRLYRKYRSMLERCYREDTWKYKRYGGRGIYVCDEWRKSFVAFKDWAYKSGYNPELNGRIEQSLDRIDNNGPYSPENCRWSTALEQQRNRECTVLYPYSGKMYTISEFCDVFGISDKSFAYRRVQLHNQSLEYVLNDWNRIKNVPEGLIDANEYAKQEGVAQATVRRWIAEGKVPGEKVGRKWYVKHKNAEKEGGYTWITLKI